MATIDEALVLALFYHQQGAFEAAATLCERVLNLAPDHFDALHLSGVSARRRGEPTAAVQRISRALILKPESAEAQLNLGNSLRDLGRQAAALTAFRRALVLRPELVAAHMGLASTLCDLERFAESIEAWQAAIRIAPEDAELRNGLGNAFQKQGSAAAAELAYRTAIVLDPGGHHPWCNLGTAWRSAKQPEAAASCQRRALAIAPSLAAGWAGLGMILADRDLPQESARCQRRALALQPDFAGAWSNLGCAHLALLRPEPAIGAFRRALVLDPAAPVPHRNLGMALLLAGDLAAGWPEYDWRLRCPDAPAPLNLPQPLWDGAPLAGRTLLVHAEQGLGDVLQFVRYVPLAAARGGPVLVCATHDFERLFASLDGMAGFVPPGTPPSGFDLHAPLLSLPRIFGTTLDTIPAQVPYLQPPAELVPIWSERLAGVDGIRVGLVWAGSAGHGNDRNRSLPLAAFAPLAAIPGVRLISLQKGPSAAQATALPAGMEVLNLSPEITDFADTAAIIESLDLVICVDTSVAHLAGALGKAVWVLIPHTPDWRWMLGRNDNPWYPTLRLFRQETPGNWTSVIGSVARHLRQLAVGKFGC